MHKNSVEDRNGKWQHREQPVILSAVRTPIGKFLGGLSPLPATELGAKVVAESVRRASSSLSRLTR